MTILDTFYILFRSNAGEAIKGNKELEKSNKEVEKSFNAATEASDQLGKSFVKMVEAGSGALAAAFSFGAVKTGILNAADFNRQLSIQGQIMGVNAKEIKAYAYAVEQAGGSFAGLQGTIQNAFNAATSAGLPLPPIDKLLRSYRSAIRGMTPSGQAAYLSQLGVTDPGVIRLLEASDVEFERRIKLGKENAELTQKETDAADRFGQAWTKAGQGMDALYSIISADVLPVATNLLEKFSEFTDSLKDNKVEVYGFVGGMIALTATLTTWLARATLGFLGLGAAAGGTAAGAAGGAAAIAAANAQWAAVTGAGAGVGLAAGGALALGAGAAAGGIIWHKDIADYLDEKIYGKEDAARRARDPVLAKYNASQSDHKAAMDFWVSQGYTREQAAGIVANEARESGGNPSAVGDNGRARGLYQWHPERRENILKNTGIDIASAGAMDQRKAAAWEMQLMGVADQVRQAKTPDEAAAIFTKNFEKPANQVMEMALRGQMALQIANSSPLNSQVGPSVAPGGGKTISVKIGDIQILTQATDASGISATIGQEINSHIRSAISNIDDGVAY